MNLRSPAFAILFSVSLIAAAGNMALQSVLPAIGREFRLSDTPWWRAPSPSRP